MVQIIPSKVNMQVHMPILQVKYSVAILKKQSETSTINVQIACLPAACLLITEQTDSDTHDLNARNGLCGAAMCSSQISLIAN